MLKYEKEELVQFRLRLPRRLVMDLRDDALDRSKKAGHYVSWCTVARELLERAKAGGAK